MMSRVSAPLRGGWSLVFPSHIQGRGILDNRMSGLHVVRLHPGFGERATVRCAGFRWQGGINQPLCSAEPDGNGPP
jgi:hypothetical protein